jgi:hypothetical protein
MMRRKITFLAEHNKKLVLAFVEIERLINYG